MKHRTTDDTQALLDHLRSELDERADRNDAFWLDQRRSITRRLRNEYDSRTGPTVGWRSRWALAGLAGAALLALVLSPGDLFEPSRLVPDSTKSQAPADTIDPDTADLLRTVEITLALDPAPSLSAADLLLAELESEYTRNLDEAENTP